MNTYFSQVAYPAPITPPVQAKVDKVKTAVLSVTQKSHHREAKKAEAMEISGQPETPAVPAPAPAPAPIEKEPDFEIKENHTRVTPAQAAVLSFDVNNRYAPVRSSGAATGIVVLRDRRGGEPESFQAIGGDAEGVGVMEEDEPAPPEAFIFDPSLN
jgi:hypothetical protein